MKLLVFDNYDSFTYNIVQLLREAGADDITVVRNDRIALEAVGRFDKIILSPGPGIPSEAGILLPLIREYAPSKSIFGVCLGEQAIGETFGASLKNLTDVYHGIALRRARRAVSSRIGTHARRPENDRKLVENINSTRQTFVKATASAQHLKSSLPDTGKHCGCTKHTQPARHHHQKGIRSIPLTKRIAQTTRNNNDKQAL